MGSRRRVSTCRSSRALGGPVRAYIPHRIREGYGLNGRRSAVAHEGISLLVTSDCGTTSHKEIAIADQLGMDVVVTDHHQTDEHDASGRGGAQPPSAWRDLSVSRGSVPRRSPIKWRRPTSSDMGSGDVRSGILLDLVALATVADVVPLHDENRIFVREGLVQLIAWRALRHSGVEAGGGGHAEPCTAETIAFKLAPRYQCRGRLDDAMTGCAVA